MGLKKQELIDGCFAKAGEDEPLFVLRATDTLAPGVIREWARQYALKKGNLGIHEPKYKSALALADAMEAWPRRKMPD